MRPCQLLLLWEPEGSDAKDSFSSLSPLLLTLNAQNAVGNLFLSCPPSALLLRLLAIVHLLHHGRDFIARSDVTSCFHCFAVEDAH